MAETETVDDQAEVQPTKAKRHVMRTILIIFLPSYFVASIIIPQWVPSLAILPHPQGREIVIEPDGPMSCHHTIETKFERSGIFWVEVQPPQIFSAVGCLN